ncbi:hypothetical protein AGMMS49928_26500 [Spirochaetia bacterium]|nr:hypothetical protein AGMMS49928_26500 [Spirochaetia bacterium]
MLAAKNVQKNYGKENPVIRGISMVIERGSTVGLWGESGCGKSTLARLLCCLEKCSAGVIEFEGRICNASDPSLYKNFPFKEFRKKVQIIFQDSQGALDPRLPLWQTVIEGYENFDSSFRRFTPRQKIRTAEELLEQVGIDPAKVRSFPHEISGGQRQRVVIARALALKPEYLICDEPVSSLDPESREGIVTLLLSLQREHNMGFLFISHDPVLSARMSRRIHVIEEGKIKNNA